ncbi:MAG: SemiSWEET transporter [Elusimicrobia bacterium]|nr:SemiSWEET transporter [Elusimicrobiota bacterium]
MEWLPVLGLAAACCTTAAFIPQVLKSWRTRQTKDVSLGMYALMSAGIALWLIYGLMKRDIPLIFSNAVTLIFVFSIFYLKFSQK